jgi:hypothetical protein
VWIYRILCELSPRKTLTLIVALCLVCETVLLTVCCKRKPCDTCGLYPVHMRGSAVGVAFETGFAVFYWLYCVLYEAHGAHRGAASAAFISKVVGVFSAMWGSVLRVDLSP